MTYVVDTSRDHPEYGIRGDHAYWVSGVTVRQTGTDGQIDVFSHGFGTSDPLASASQPGTGALTGGSDTLDVNATNIATATIDPTRAHVDCNAKLNVTSDGPITVTLAGCNRTVQPG